MKIVLKKISAVAMAFTLLGAGTAVTKTVSPKSDNSLTAQAYMPPQYCNHNCGWHNCSFKYIGGNLYLCGFCDNCGTPVAVRC